MSVFEGNKQAERDAATKTETVSEMGWGWGNRGMDSCIVFTMSEWETKISGSLPGITHSVHNIFAVKKNSLDPNLFTNMMLSATHKIKNLVYQHLTFLTE